MSRLIDADELMNYCLNLKEKKIDCNDIVRFPTAYNVDEVVKELEEIGKKYCENVDCHMYQNCDGCEHKDLMECAIEIVKRSEKNDNYKH